MAILDQLQALPAQWQEAAREHLSYQKQALKLLLARAKNPVQSSFDLGGELMDRRLYNEAKMRFKFVLWRRPTYAAAWYNLAICHFAMRESAAGMEALNKAIACNPQDEMALYLKASYDQGKYAGGMAPHTTPLPLLQAEFSQIAPAFAWQEMNRGYRAPMEIAKQLLELKVPQGDVLDAGCGSGGSAVMLSLFAKTLTGVDAVPEMLREARRRRSDFYTQLIQADLRDHLLQSRAPAYDLIAAVHVLPLVGGLTAVFDGAAKSLRPGGIFIFTAYLLKASEGYQFQPATRQFLHSLNYIKTQAERKDFTILSLRDIALYDGETRPAILVTLRK